MRVAVVGSGVSGLAATWLLNEFSGHEVHLFEADGRAGGHANTVKFARPGTDGAESIDVDTGFIVFNPSTYPNFLHFLALYPTLQFAVQSTEMTFSVSRDGGKFEWAGTGLAAVFCQMGRVLDQRMWRMLYDIMRFNACAGRLLVGSDGKGSETKEVSIGTYLEHEGYSDAFRDDYLLPMTAAIWSTPPDKCALGFPARTLVQFMHNHHLLQITGKPPWLTLRGGSRLYVNKIISSLPPSQLHLNTPIRAVTSYPTSGSKFEVRLETQCGATKTFDHVILACHADTSLDLLRAGGGVTREEQQILGKFKFSKNEAVLHVDTRLMPKRRKAWACWNYLTYTSVGPGTGKPSTDAVDRVSLTYNMNGLQHISELEHGPVLVTLNPPFEPDSATVVARFQYEHPIMNADSIRAQRDMSSLQNIRGISYAGAWMKYGFHEDGFTAGLRAALSLRDEALGSSVRCPFDVQDAEYTPQLGPAEVMFDLLERTGVRAVMGTVFGLGLDVCGLLVAALLSLVTFSLST